MNGSWRRVNQFSFKASKKLFLGLLTGLLSSDEKARLCRQSGLSLDQSSKRFIVIMEKKGGKRGQGFFLIRRKKVRIPYLVQAPHGGSDRYSGSLCMKLFLESNFKAAAFNSVSRKTVDLAHTYGTYFQAFTIAFSEIYRTNGRILQIHGFSFDKHPDLKKRQIDLIISNGTRYPTEDLNLLYRRLKGNGFWNIARFPLEINELGGTLNAQKKIVEKNGFKYFIHLELSLKLRKDLFSKSKIRRNFIKAFDVIRR